MRQTNTNHLRAHRALPIHPGKQFALDAYTNTTRSYRKYKYCDILTDIATGQSYPLLTVSRSAAELCRKMRVFLDMHPTWRTPTTPPTPRFLRVDPESNYNSELFLSLLDEYSYIVERTPPRDKHANGIAERAVGVKPQRLMLQCLHLPQMFHQSIGVLQCLMHVLLSPSITLHVLMTLLIISRLVNM